MKAKIRSAPVNDHTPVFVRGGLIHHVDAMPFVMQPYGLDNGWTPGSAR